MARKYLICPAKKRRIPRGFSWLDHRLARSGHLKRCSSDALAVYLFLVVVGDEDGLSYYSDSSMGSLLPLTTEQLRQARKNLIQAELIAYASPLYQVLDIIASPRTRCPGLEKEGSFCASPNYEPKSASKNFPRSKSSSPQHIAELLKDLFKEEQT